jgi:lipoprotein-releasing system ATP-binding protein
MKISLEQVSKSYNDAGRSLTVLNQVDFALESGSHCSVIGRSGVGKSTLLHLLGALDVPTAGRIMLGDTDITSLDGDARSDFRGQSVGFIFQFHHLLPEFTALENVAMPLFIQGVPESDANARAQSLLQRSGLHDRASHRPGELSGGEQQRVAVARALVHEPQIVLADEPTGSLDVQTGGEIQELMIEMCSAVGSTLVVVTHNRELASSFESVYEMQPGGTLQAVTN